jgi:hypothetical protein
MIANAATAATERRVVGTWGRVAYRSHMKISVIL